MALRSQTTSRALIEEGLRRVISDSQVQAKTAFKLKKTSVLGKAVLMPEPASWQQLEEHHVANRALAGGQFHDARIAAICLENAVSVLWAADRDFGRFKALKTINPLV